MKILKQGKAWLMRLRDAAPLAWRRDQIFRYMVAVGIVAWTAILLHVGQHPRHIIGY